MDKDAQIAQRSQPDGQARSASNLSFKINHIDPGHWLQVCELERSPTGLLALFRLIPQFANGVTCRVRIDDGSPKHRREPEVDIDISGVSLRVQADFKADRNGSSGHHSTQVMNNNQRIYLVRINVAGQLIFDAEISFNLSFLVGSSEIGDAEDRGDSIVTKGGGLA